MCAEISASAEWPKKFSAKNFSIFVVHTKSLDSLKDSPIYLRILSIWSLDYKHKNGDNFFAIGPIELKKILARDYRWPDRNPAAYDISGKQTN